MNEQSASIIKRIFDLPFVSANNQSEDISVATKAEFKIFRDELGDNYSAQAVINLIDDIISKHEADVAHQSIAITSRNFVSQMERVVKATESYKNTGSQKDKDRLTTHWQKYASSCLYTVDDLSDLIDDTSNYISVMTRLSYMVDRLPLHDKEAKDIDALVRARRRIDLSTAQQYRTMSILQNMQQASIDNLERCKRVIKPYLAPKRK